jgi:mannonate dehydratase
MKNNRREFIKKTSAMAALSIAAVSTSGSGMIDLIGGKKKQPKEGLQGKKPGYIQDAGIKMCFAYFSGIEAEKRKIEFGKQLDVLGAVGGINPAMV